MTSAIFLVKYCVYLPEDFFCYPCFDLINAKANFTLFPFIIIIIPQLLKPQSNGRDMVEDNLLLTSNCFSIRSLYCDGTLNLMSTVFRDQMEHLVQVI